MRTNLPIFSVPHRRRPEWGGAATLCHWVGGTQEPGCLPGSCRNFRRLTPHMRIFFLFKFYDSSHALPSSIRQFARFFSVHYCFIFLAFVTRSFGLYDNNVPVAVVVAGPRAHLLSQRSSSDPFPRSGHDKAAENIHGCFCAFIPSCPAFRRRVSYCVFFFRRGRSARLGEGV